MPNEKENEMKRPKYDTYESAYVEELKAKLKAAHAVVSLAVEFTSHSLYGSPAMNLAKAIDAYNYLEPHPSTINDPQTPTKKLVTLPAETVEKIRRVLERHHKWHQDQTDPATLLIVDENGDKQEVELILADEYADSSLYDQTIEALSLLPLEDHDEAKRRRATNTGNESK